MRAISGWPTRKHLLSTLWHQNQLISRQERALEETPPKTAFMYHHFKLLKQTIAAKSFFSWAQFVWYDVHFWENIWSYNVKTTHFDQFLSHDSIQTAKKLIGDIEILSLDKQKSQNFY